MGYYCFWVVGVCYLLGNSVDCLYYYVCFFCIEFNCGVVGIDGNFCLFVCLLLLSWFVVCLYIVFGIWRLVVLFPAFMVDVDLRNSVAFFLFSVDLMLLLGMFACWLLFDRFRFACLVCLL